MNPAEALAEARRKKAVARSHKRAQDHHRKQAKLVMGELAKFCQRYGISMEFVLEEQSAASPGRLDDFDRALIQRDRDHSPDQPVEAIARDVQRDLENNQARRPSDSPSKDPYDAGPRADRRQRRQQRRARRLAGRRAGSGSDRAGA